MKELDLTQGSVPKVLLQFAVPFDSAFECAALEEFLLANVQTTDNSIFQR